MAQLNDIKPTYVSIGCMKYFIVTLFLFIIIVNVFLPTKTFFKDTTTFKFKNNLDLNPILTIKNKSTVNKEIRMQNKDEEIINNRILMSNLTIPRIHGRFEDKCRKKDRKSHVQEDICALYMIKNNNSDKYGVIGPNCDMKDVNKKHSHEIENVAVKDKIRFISSKEELIECIKYYFHERNNYISQDFHDEEALKLHLELISRQLCFTTWNDISLEYFSELTLTKTYKPLEISSLRLFNPILFLKQIEKTSFCKKTPTIYVPTTSSYGTGLGSRLIWFIHAISVSFTYRTPKSRILMTEKGNWPFGVGGNCTTEDHRCFFNIFSNCYVNSIKYHSLWEENSIENIVIPNMPLTYYPKKYEKKGIFWFHNQISFYLFQPKLNILKHINIIKQKYNTIIEPNMVTLHIRRGDKYKEGKLFKFESYLFAIRKLEITLKTEIRTILIITDDINLQNYIEKYNKIENYNYFFVNKPPKGSNTVLNSFDRIKHGKLNGYEQTISLLEALYLSIEGKYFVGTLNSNFSRMFFRIMSAKQNRIIDHISLNQWRYDNALSFWNRKFETFGCTILNF